MPTFLERLGRRKFVTFEESNLPRVLNTLDLTALGIGATVGVGFYVLAGEVAKNKAGPAVCLSFLIAAIACVFAGLCYAEFGARVPKAGSAYIYSYVCVGEFVAFVIGWNLILEFVIGSASVASGYSSYIDKIFNNTISTTLTEVMPINVKHFNEYPDFLAFGLTFALSVVLSLGVKESSRMNNFFTLINLAVIAFVIIAAGTQANVLNWQLTEEDLDNVTICKEEGNWGSGGFAPYGFAGIMQGAATCFFGFVGFDCIATTGEEAKSPEKTIPRAIILALFFVFISYFGMSTVITLVVPYCSQDEKAPLVYVFDYLNWNVAMWIVSIGALFGFSSSLFGAMFPVPRIVYAMADDGLLFRCLSKINKRFKTPMIATYITGLFAGVMALIFDLDSLVQMMSIGTLMAYSIVAVCVMLLRFSGDEEASESLTENGLMSSRFKKSTYKVTDYLNQCFNSRRLKEPTDLTSSLVGYATFTFCILSIILSLILVLLDEYLAKLNVASVVVAVVVAALSILNVIIIGRQPEASKKLAFKVPFVPYLPAFSFFINIYLMCSLSVGTWVKYAVWMAIGFAMYFLYGIFHSKGKMEHSSGKEGVDNPGFESNGIPLRVIPVIHIQPATPISSQPGTPRMAGARSGTARQAEASPLARVVLEKCKVENDDDKKGDNEEKDEISEALDCLDRVNQRNDEKLAQSTSEGSPSPKSDTQSRELPSLPDAPEMTKDTKDKVLEEYDDDGGYEKLKKQEGSESDTRSRELPSLPDAPEVTKDTKDKVLEEYDDDGGYEKLKKQEGSESETDYEDVDKGKDETEKNDIEENENEKELEKTVGHESPESKNNDDFRVTEEENRPSKDEIDGSDSLSNKTTKEIRGNLGKLQNKLVIAELHHIFKSQEKKEEEKEAARPSSSPEPVYAKVNKTKKKPEPIEIPSDISSDSDSSRPQSAPHEIPSPPPPPLVGMHRVSSTPSIPQGGTHPIKKLRRMYSFDDIPPSSPDSPLARRVGNKFTIIPVRDPDKEWDSDSSNFNSPSVTPVAIKKPLTRSFSQPDMIKELQKKLASREVKDIPKVSETPAVEESKTEPVNVVADNDDDDDDSLEKALERTTSDSWITSMPSPVITSQTREFKRILSKENILSLDPIRERGESKIVLDEEDRVRLANTLLKTLGKQEMRDSGDSENKGAKSKDKESPSDDKERTSEQASEKTEVINDTEKNYFINVEVDMEKKGTDKEILDEIPAGEKVSETPDQKLTEKSDSPISNVINGEASNELHQEMEDSGKKLETKRESKNTLIEERNVPELKGKNVQRIGRAESAPEINKKIEEIVSSLREKRNTSEMRDDKNKPEIEQSPNVSEKKREEIGNVSDDTKVVKKEPDESEVKKRIKAMNSMGKKEEVEMPNEIKKAITIINSMSDKKENGEQNKVKKKIKALNSTGGAEKFRKPSLNIKRQPSQNEKFSELLSVFEK
ncbi:uncharacterized protein LOC143027072 isoform X2 [Oratosquilla oratoria]|uniref:uncharacterized protein LOC143027072 isoform X2 n=1 Tax=Oratosquilla oratoria TaxID=337810 RepID=UPI003F761BA9